MNREIKFRGWDGKKWVYGCYYHGVVYPSSYKTHNVGDWMIDEDSLGQYTGLKDKNGKEIFDGDVIKWDDEIQHEKVIHSLDWDGQVDETRAPFMSAFGSTCGKYFRTFMNVYNPTKYAEVIGNVYENSDLMNAELKS